jgi:plasmid stabilization system protein ParE
MTYRVELTSRAERDLEMIFLEINASSSGAAERWFRALERKIIALRTMPDRGAIVPGTRGLRQILHGRKPDVYRIVYRVGSRAGVVLVLHIRHGRRDGAGLVQTCNKLSVDPVTPTE